MQNNGKNMRKNRASTLQCAIFGSAGMLAWMSPARAAFVEVSTSSLAYGTDSGGNSYVASDNYDSNPQTSEVAHSQSGSGGPYSSFSDSEDAQFGQLHAEVTTSGGGNASGPGGGAGIAHAVSQFADVIHVTSSTLAPGTPVDLQLHIGIDYTISSDDPRSTPTKSVSTEWHVNGGLGAPDGTSFNFSDTWGSVPTGPNTLNIVLHSEVGDTINVTGGLTLDSQDQGPYGGQGITNTDVDASNTAAMTLVPITIGASISADSDVSYVPEPAALALAAPMALLIRRRRKNRRDLCA